MPDTAANTGSPDSEREYGRIWLAKPKVVISTSLEETRWRTRVVASAVLDELRRLKREAASHVLCYGGSQLASTLQAAGLADEYVLFVHPTALGAGQPFFRAQVALRLRDVRRFQNGALRLWYAAAPAPD